MSFILSLGIAATGLILALWLGRRVLRRLARKTVLEFRARLDRFKFVGRDRIRADLLGDSFVRAAIERHAAEQAITPARAEAQVARYIEEIVPAFNVLSYYKIAYTLSRLVTRFFYHVNVDYQDRGAMDRLPRRDVVVYMMNHRSNIDYVVVMYVLARVVSISYAVGEWARTWPLESIFKSFGSYFIRRRFPELLYHAVLERYIQLITRHRVTQGIFPEGGLSKDGALRPPKVGLLDYIVRTVRDPAFDGDIWIVPVGINYDQVLEDRTLTRELVVGARRRSRLAQLGGWVAFALSNGVRFMIGQGRRYGRVAVMFGRPMSVREWLSHERADVLELPRAERLPAIERLAAQVMERIGAVVPVTPVPFVAAALLSFPRTLIPEAQLLERLEELRDRLADQNARMIRSELPIEEVWERAWQTFRMRRWVVRDGPNVVILPNARPLLQYYANGIRHLLPPEARWELSPAVGEDVELPRLAGQR